MDIVNEFLENFTEFYEQDEVDANLLPANVQSQFLEVAQFLREIKEREDKVAAFKTKLYDFLSERGIRKVACDDFSFTVVAPTQQISVDYKALFTKEIEAKKPRVAKQLKEKYKKTTNKKGFVLIHVNNDDKS
jgi:predicted NAD/FAD-binding protein